MVNSVNFGNSPDAQDYQIQQAQQLAQLLQQQSMQPIDTATPNSRISWTQGLQKLLQGYQAGNERRKVSQLLDTKNQQAQADVQSKIQQLLPQQPTMLDSPDGSPATALSTSLQAPDLAHPGQNINISPQAQQLAGLFRGMPPEAANQFLTGKMAERMFPPVQQPFDLAKGAKRYDAQGNLIASNADAGTLEHVSRQLNERQAQEGTFNKDTGEYKWGAPHLARDPSQSAFGAAAQGDLTPEALHDAVIDVMADPHRISQYASGMGGQRTRIAINNEKAKTLRELGMTEDQVVRQQAIAKAQIKSVGDLVPMQNAVQAYETVARGNGDRALELINKVNTAGVPILNSAVRLGSQQAGNPDAAELVQVLQNYQTEVARIISNPRLVGQLTDTARKEIENVVPANLTPAQAERIIKRLNFEFELRNKGLQDSIDSAQGQITPGFNQPAPAATPAGSGKPLVYDPATGTFK